MLPSLRCALLTAAAVSLSANPANAAESPAATARRLAYQGWPEAIVLSNGLVEAVIVPQVGRVMQFRFAGEDEGPLWVNPALRGQRRDPAARDWANFGGDKAWPSPQTDWTRLAGHPWPPPVGFDGLPMEAVCEGSTVTLVSAIEPRYGIRVRRTIELAAGRPVMTITTRFEKTTGEPLEAGVWVVTQAGDPVLLAAVLPDDRAPGAAYAQQSEALPANLEVAGRLVLLTRDPKLNHKIGARAGTLVWVGQRELLRIDSPLVPDGRYPDAGCSVELYTNADPLPYIELEMLGPLEHLAADGHLERRSTYTLARRTGLDPLKEIEHLLRP